jgi:hypothetical protein
MGFGLAAGIFPRIKICNGKLDIVAAIPVDFAHAIREIGWIVQRALVAACLPDCGE